MSGWPPNKITIISCTASEPRRSPRAQVCVEQQQQQQQERRTLQETTVSELKECVEEEEERRFSIFGVWPSTIYLEAVLCFAITSSSLPSYQIKSKVCARETQVHRERGSERETVRQSQGIGARPLITVHRSAAAENTSPPPPGIVSQCVLNYGTGRVQVQSQSSQKAQAQAQLTTTTTTSSSVVNSPPRVTKSPPPVRVTST